MEDADATPLGHEPIRLGNEIIGETTSAAFGHRIGRPLALGTVKPGAPEGSAVKVEIARQLFKARLTLAPAFDPEGRRMRPGT